MESNINKQTEYTSAAARRDRMGHEALARAARAVVDAVENDMADDGHMTGDGRSAVILQGIASAKHYLTAPFLALLQDLEWALDREGGAE